MRSWRGALRVPGMSNDPAFFGEIFCGAADYTGISPQGNTMNLVNYAMYLDAKEGTSVEELSRDYGFSVEYVREHVEAARLCFEQQVRRRDPGNAGPGCRCTRNGATIGRFGGASRVS
jgi:hypothetical protein